MRASVLLGNIVCEGEDVLVIAVVPPHRDIYGDAVLLAAHDDGGVDQRVLRPVEIAHERLDPALVEQRFLDGLGVTLIAQHNGDAGI